MSDPHSALLASVRRSLCYPLYRHFDLAQTVIKDVQQIFSLGRRALVKAMIAMRSLMNRTEENRYILNDLYISDYCVWIQDQADDDAEFVACKNAVQNFILTKKDVSLELELIEEAARLVLQEQENFISDNEKGKQSLEGVFAKLKVDSDDEE